VAVVVVAPTDGRVVVVVVVVVDLVVEVVVVDLGVVEVLVVDFTDDALVGGGAVVDVDGAVVAGGTVEVVVVVVTAGRMPGRSLPLPVPAVTFAAGGNQRLRPPQTRKATTSTTVDRRMRMARLTGRRMDPARPDRGGRSPIRTRDGSPGSTGWEAMASSSPASTPGSSPGPGVSVIGPPGWRCPRWGVS
jgi:hypothetical protein